MKLETRLSIEVDGVTVEYGKIPSGLIEDWDGIVYYFQTSNAYDAEIHEKVVGEVIKQLESQSFDHWDEYCQITLVSFRVKDSY